MISTEDLRVYYLGRFGEEDNHIFLSDSGILSTYIPESEIFVLYSDNRFMKQDDFTLGSKNVGHWSSCCRCGKDSGNLSDMQFVGLVDQGIPDKVDVSPRSLRTDIHKTLYQKREIGISEGYLCSQCYSDLDEVIAEAIDGRSDRIASIVL